MTLCQMDTQEIGKIMSYPPFFSLPGFLVPDSSKKLQPPRYCYGWVIPDFWWKVWGDADEKLMAWTQIKKQKKREECLLGDAIPEEWDPDYDDYVNYLVCVPDEKQIRINVARDWARRANVKLPLYDAPIVKVMANHKGHDLFALYDNYTLDEGLTPKEIDTLRSVWTVNERVDPQWYPVLPVDGQEFRWTPS
ncbi:hypothetical protein EIP86_009277 [Pleurotus ostreatoroseus]|nr:hypothetical protein EIP86_009277 [Pleurotus ostreatoroseus]